jgi:pyruvate dehydrogenase E1 component
VGDFIWAAADARARGFLIGATAGRTTLSGEGLQHEDGSSHLHATTVPSCRAYDPCFGYELAAIVQEGMQRMLDREEDVFYYITVMNENYVHGAMPNGAQARIVRGMYLLRPAADEMREAQAQLLASGTILREALAAADMLEQEFGIAANVWSVTSFTELRRDGLAVERWNTLHPTAPQRTSYVETCLSPTAGPIVAASDYVRALPDLIRTWVPRRYVTLGTDGYGRSDTRAALRRFFEVDRKAIVISALKALSDEERVAPAVVEDAMKRYGVSGGTANPWDA